jgi:hypothetical protein
MGSRPACATKQDPISKLKKPKQTKPKQPNKKSVKLHKPKSTNDSNFHQGKKGYVLFMV